MKKMDGGRGKKRLYDRDFLFGIFPAGGFIKGADVPFFPDAPEKTPEEKEDASDNNNSTSAS